MSDIHVTANIPSLFRANLSIRQGERIRSTGVGAWNHQIAAVIISGVVNDRAVVLVEGSHQIAPHGELPLADAFGPGGSIVAAYAGALCLHVVIDADKYDEGEHTVQAPMIIKTHPVDIGSKPHYDYWTLEVTFTVSSKLFADSITLLTAKIDAEHVTDRPIPLPPENPPIELDREEAEAIIEKLRKWRESVEEE